MFIIYSIKIVLVFINAVWTSDISNGAYKPIQNVDRVLREVYKFNHPPEETIPVAIVFEETGSREGKSIDNKANNNILPNKEIGDIQIHTLPRERGDFNVKSSDNNAANIKISDTKIIKEDLQIPVAVVYEQEHATVRNNKQDLQRSKNRNHGHSNRRRVQKVVPKISNNTISGNETTIHENITTTTETLNNFDNSKKKVETENTHNRPRSRERDPVIPIIQSENQVYGHSGDFHYSYEGGDGTQVFEKGELKSFEDNKTGESVVGSFSYTDKNGQDFSLSYTADENGYRPTGAHLPTPPPIPPAIERALRYLATKTTPEPVTDSVAHSKDDSD
ncbi:uncharacterized protein LOC106132691 [Amyelois transitella]|uniref:uncharacterized protein LOC106132691 n=1 Tax=Amyelois transitella TaxID=680683 RepID=UPI00298FDEA2|nr:uncharacterized protein LOC106132691 [Amyelois transitella]